MKSKEFLQRFDRNIKGRFSALPSLISSMEVQSRKNILIIDSGLPCDMFNIICCDTNPTYSSVRAAIEGFRSKKLPYAFWIGFEGQPPWLEEKLQELGLITDEVEWAMACDLHQYYPKIEMKDFQVVKACDHIAIREVIEVMSSIFPKHEKRAISDFYTKAMPFLLTNHSPITFFLGYENKEPVALASIYFEEGLASIFDVIVVEQKRGRGLGKIMTQYVMQEAKKQGSSQCVLTATNDARYLYQKLGFKDVKTMKVYHEEF